MSSVKLPSSGSSTTIEDQAAEWFARRQSGLKGDDVARFQTWIEADERHVAAMAELDATWAAISFPSTAGKVPEADRRLANLAAQRTRRRQRWALGSLGLAAAAALVVTFGPWVIRSTTNPSVPQVAVRPNVEILPDGSTVELNSEAQITVFFTPGTRLVRLIRGEALFSVKKNATRPFIVAAGGVDVRAVGTAFSVHYGAKQVDVLVTEGRVAVARNDGADQTNTLKAEPIYLGAGGRVAVPLEATVGAAPAVQPVSSEQMTAALAWRGKRIEFSSLPVAQAVELLNKQNQIQIVVADAKVGEIPLSGIFWTDDPETFARLLESGMNVRAERVGDTIRLSSR